MISVSFVRAGKVQREQPHHMSQIFRLARRSGIPAPPAQRPTAPFFHERICPFP